MEEPLTLTQEIEIVDEFDKFLMEEILAIVQNNMTFTFVSAWAHNKLQKDKADEEFFQKIMLSVNALIKANALRRNYYKIKDDLIEEIKTSPDVAGARIEMLFNKVDAFILIEGFFGQIKTSLDLLAQSLKPIYGVRFDTYKRKDNVSGQAIINSLNNLAAGLKPHALPLTELMTKHADEITKIVAHRDDTVHYGKLKKVQGFRYSPPIDKVIPPLILIKENESAYVHEYLDEVLEYTSLYIQEFIVTMLSNLMTDMRVVKMPDGKWGWAGNFPK